MTKLPPGQHELGEFPRFGLSQFIRRFPADTHHVSLTITGDTEESFTVSDELRDLPRADRTRTRSTYPPSSSGVMIGNIDHWRPFDSWTIRGLASPWRSVAEAFRVGCFGIFIVL